MPFRTREEEVFLLALAVMSRVPAQTFGNGMVRHLTGQSFAALSFLSSSFMHVESRSGHVAGTSSVQAPLKRLGTAQGPCEAPLQLPFVQLGGVAQESLPQADVRVSSGSKWCA